MNDGAVMSGPALDVSVKVAFGGDPPVRIDATLVAPPGVTVLFGPSGSGKSTVLKVIAGILRPDSGHVRLGNETWVDTGRGIAASIESRRVGYVFQSLALFPHMSALDNVAYGIAKSRPDRLDRAKKALATFRAGHLEGRKPGTFSGGESQRVALARALAMEPRCVLLDEPFSAMDRGLRTEFAEHVRVLADELRVPVLHVTHHRHEAIAMASRVVFLEKGTVVRVGSPADLVETAPHG
ncbi:MAG: ATP-binding cassette domain-containing protein [Polyangiaceae bacterium]